MKKIMLIAFAVAVSTVSARTIAYWTFGEKGLQDVSGNGHTLEADANVTIGETAVMNGAQKLFSTVNALDLSGCPAVTIEFWTKFNGADNPVKMFLELTENTSNNAGGFYVIFGEAANAVMGMFKPRGGNSGAEENPVIGFGDGQWHHIAFVIDPRIQNETCTTLYVDKKNIYTHCHVYPGANAFGATAFPANKKLYIGSRANNSLQFKGEIDNLRVSNEALTPDEFVNQDGSAPSPAPIAYWPFGSAGAMDKSGNGHDLYLGPTGVTLAEGALAFDGTGADCFTRLPIDLRECKKGLTTEFWFRAPAGTAKTQMLLEHSPLSTTFWKGNSSFYFDLNEGSMKLAAMLRTTEGHHIDANTTTDLLDDAWHHVAYVIDPTEKGHDICRLYLDGVKQPQSTAHAGTNILGLAKEHLYFGGRSGRQYPMKGEIDDVRIVASALNQEQFMATRTTEDASVIGHWTFNRGSEQVNARGTATLTGTGVTYANGAALLDGSGTFATAALGLDETAAVTAECFYRDGEAWHHLVKVYGAGCGAEPTLVTIDGETASSPLLTFVSCALQVAGAGFTGSIDDVRVTMGALSSTGLLASRTDDTPVELAHWRFDVMNDEGRDEVGCNPLSPVSQSAIDTLLADRALSICHSAGLRTLRPLHLAHWPAFTIEWFARTTQTKAGNFLELGTNFNNQIGRFCASTSFMDDGSPGAGFRTAWGHNIRTTPKGVSTSDGQWHRYAYVVDRSSGSLQTAFYVDGVAQNCYGSYSSTANTAFVDDHLMVGARYGAFYNYFNYASLVGNIDEIRIVNGALKESELMTMAERTAQNNTAIAHWRFEGETPLADLTGNGYDLTGTAEISEGMAHFSGSTSLQTVKALSLSGYRQVTVEAVFQTDAPEETAILFETSDDYAKTDGSISCYYNGAGANYGSVDACTRRLAWTTDNTRLRDTRWHHVAVELDMNVTTDKRLRYYIDGVPVGIWIRAYESAPLAAITTFADRVLNIGSRAGKAFFMKGRMKEVRVTAGLVAPAEFLERPAPEADANKVVAYWPFTDGTNWRQDATGHGYELCEAGTGVTLTEGRVVFDANHAALTTTTPIDFGKMDKFTIEAFVRPRCYANLGVIGTSTWLAATKSHASSFLFATSTNATGNVDLQGAVVLDSLCNCKGGLIPVYANGGPNTFLSLDRWSHIAIVVDRTAGTNGSVSYYVNRKLVFSQLTDVSPNFAAVPLGIGNLVADVATARFIGDIDDVRLSAAALTPDEMLRHRTSTRGTLLYVK